MWYDFSDPESLEIPYGQLIDALDTNNRWVYKGSVTTPPCATTVYWNVLSKVYPIQPKHLAQYKMQLVKREAADPNNAGKNVDYNGNYRVTNEIKDHDLRILKVNDDEEQTLEE